MAERRDGRVRAIAETSEPGNVIPFVRSPNESEKGEAPPVVLKRSERPAPRSVNSADRQLWIFLLLLGSLALHGSLLALFRHEPEPYSSIGIPAISVEIVLGADTPAGVAQTPSPSETQESTPPEEESKPVETPPVAEAEEKEPEAPLEQAEAEPEPPVAEAVTEPPAVQPKSEPKRKPKETKQATEKAKPPPASRNAQASSGVGRGRSSSDANYHGLVAAHLARHKQYPAEARTQRAEGSASVTFAIDGGGRVTSVRLARSSGAAALDQEAVTMVRRASPFPAPPGGAPMSFTVPVSFAVR